MKPYRIDAVLFDFDGTLTKPGAIDFPGLREALGARPGTYALEYLTSLPDGPEQVRAEEILSRFEVEGADRSEPNEGAQETVRWLRDEGIPLGLITRNRREMVERALGRFPDLSLDHFDVVVTRDVALPFKPHPDTILYAAEQLGVPPERAIMVGDFVVDVEAGHRAGALTAHLLDPEDEEEPDHDPDFRIHRLTELEEIVRLGRPLPAGKLPNDLLARFVEGIPSDPSVLVSAGVGEDVAALEIAGEEVLVAHADPITLASRDLGTYAVVVNANDLATSGADPRWFVATVLLPPGTTGSEALALAEDVSSACRRHGVALVGGHTEITDAVTRPVVGGTMLGTVARADLRDKTRVSSGDAIVLTGRVAVEGTALLARELGDRLAGLGMTADEIATAAAFADRLSVVPAGRIARGFASVAAMHDVTEGGLATALRELAAATGRTVRVHRERIRVYPETTRICDLVGADPLGLIGSGSLLICVGRGEADDLTAALVAAGVEAAVIGEVGGQGDDVTAFDGGEEVAWPSFVVDEAARLLA